MLLALVASDYFIVQAGGEEAVLVPRRAGAYALQSLSFFPEARARSERTGPFALLGDRPLDERFADGLGRIRNREALSGELEAVLGTREVAHWVERLNEAGVPAGPVLDMRGVVSDPQVQAREMLVELPHPEVGTFRTTGLPVKLSRTPGELERPPPLHGEHTDEVLGELGYSPEAIRALRAAQVV